MQRPDPGGRRMMRRLLILMLTAALLSGAVPFPAEPVVWAGSTTDTAVTTATDTDPAADMPTAAAARAFHGSVRELSVDLRQRMRGVSWHKGCPVPLRNLRLVTVSRYRWNGKPGHGWLVVHADVANDVVRAFEHLYTKKFRIRSLKLVDRYGGDDTKSMDANNTSAFNCRAVSGTSTWSQHSYGRAIDLNPVQNPYVRGSVVQPDRGRRYLDRDDVRKGMIVQPGPARWAFVRVIDWQWGGNWSSSKDYQHFSSNGR
ncbi:MAG: M15 family metallopeptidase [Actinomycetota bacterium]|nr:M15 family metallopeptidase [Actinomycetota bacterium]